VEEVAQSLMVEETTMANVYVAVGIQHNEDEDTRPDFHMKNILQVLMELKTTKRDRQPMAKNVDIMQIKVERIQGRQNTGKGRQKAYKGRQNTSKSRRKANRCRQKSNKGRQKLDKCSQITPER